MRLCTKDAVNAVLDNGFRISHANLDVRHNRYGVGPRTWRHCLLRGADALVARC